MGERRSVKPWAPKEWRLIVLHGPSHTSGTVAERAPTHGWRGPRDKRALPFLSQENIELPKSSALPKQPGNKKTQKTNNRNDQAAITRHFLNFS